MSRLAGMVAAAGGKAEAHQIDQSLVFNRLASHSYGQGGPRCLKALATTGNRKVFTFSCWVRRNKIATYGYQAQTLFGAGRTDDYGSDEYFDFGFKESTDQLRVYADTDNHNTEILLTTRQFRDVSAWYHIVLQIDSTQATLSNRMRLYVNGVQETEFDTYTLTQNDSFGVNYKSSNTVYHSLGSAPYNIGTGPYPFDGQMAEAVLLDGTSKDATYFGTTDSDTDQWIPKKIGTSGFGTNGFHCKFARDALGTDSSSNGNNFTVSGGIDAWDSILDTPTNSIMNMSTTASKSQAALFEGGGLDCNVTTAGDFYASTLMPESGKWYMEVLTVDKTVFHLGMSSELYTKTDGSWNLGYIFAQLAAGSFYNSSATVSYGSALSDGDIVGMAVDMDAGKIWFSINGTWQNSGNPATAANPAPLGGAVGSTFDKTDRYRIISYGNTSSHYVFNFGQSSYFNGQKTSPAGTHADGNGYGQFTYAPPSGFLCLCIKNWPDPAITPSEHFKVVTYTGNGSTNNITSVGFQPDMVWIKCRNEAASMKVHDVARGFDNGTHLDGTVAQSDQSANFTGVSATGFNLAGTDVGYNKNNNTYVAWCWKFNTSTTSDSNGSRTSTLRKNSTAGQVLGRYTGAGSGVHTIGHGLGAKPEMIVTKAYETNGTSWGVYLRDGNYLASFATWYMLFQDASAGGDYAGVWADTEPTTSVFSVGSDGASGGGFEYFGFWFKNVENYSASGMYKGSGLVHNPHIYCGFQPAYIMIKRTDATDPWYIFDKARDSNANTKTITHHGTGVEASAPTDIAIDICSNGFRLAENHIDINGSGNNYWFWAIADVPFKYARAN